MKNLKRQKLFAFIIICIMAITLAACTSGDDVKNKETAEKPAIADGQFEQSEEPANDTKIFGIGIK